MLKENAERETQHQEMIHHLNTPQAEQRFFIFPQPDTIPNSKKGAYPQYAGYAPFYISPYSESG